MARTGRPPRSQEEIEFNRKLGERIEALRIKSRIPQGDMARAIGIERAKLYWYESGRSAVPPLILAKIAHELGVTVQALMPKDVTNSVILLQMQKTLIG